METIPSIKKSITTIWRSEWSILIILIFISISAPILQTLIPYCMKFLIDTLQVYQNNRDSILTHIRWPLISIISLFLLIELITRLEGILLVYWMPRIRLSLRKIAYLYILKHSHQFYLEKPAGKVLELITNLTHSVETIVMLCLFNFLPLFAVLTSSFIILWQRYYLIDIILIMIVIILPIISMPLYRIYTNYAKAYMNSHINTNGMMHDVINNIQTVNLFHTHNHEADYFQDFQQEEISKSRKQGFIFEGIKAINGCVMVIFSALLYWWLIILWQKQTITLGDFSLIPMLSIVIINQFSYISFQSNIFFKELQAIKFSYHYLFTEYHIKENINASTLDIKNLIIKFKDITFSYHKDNSLFKNFNLTITGGKRIGFVGKSGSGKTTLINLLLRTYDIKYGSIYIDQKNIKDITLQSLREQIAFVPQESKFFNRTILENIQYGKIDATLDEIKRVAKLTCCHDFILKMPKGYDTQVGSKDCCLSGGERQRLALARAVLKQSPILILDEATSAIDPKTEKIIFRNLQYYFKNCILIIISHKFSTLQFVDEVAIFENGKIIEHGNVNQLMEKNSKLVTLLQPA